MKSITEKPKSRARGRVKNVDAIGGLYTFIMRGPNGTDPGGVYVRKRNHRFVEHLSFGYLASGAVMPVRVGEQELKISLRPSGIEVTRPDKTVVTIGYDTVANLTQKQPTLFP